MIYCSSSYCREGEGGRGAYNLPGLGHVPKGGSVLYMARRASDEGVICETKTVPDGSTLLAPCSVPGLALPCPRRAGLARRLWNGLWLSRSLPLLSYVLAFLSEVCVCVFLVQTSLCICWNTIGFLFCIIAP